MNLLRRSLAALLVALPLGACVALPPDAVRKELAPTGTLRAAINFNNPPLAHRDERTGALQGLAVDLSRELARRTGLPLKLIPYEAAGKIAGSAKDNAWDVAYLAIDPLRANEIEFTDAHVELEGTYLVPPGSSIGRIEDVDRDGVRIAVTAHSAYDLFLSRTLEHAQLVRAENTPRSFELMREQRLDAVAAVRTALVAQAKHFPGSRVLGGHFMTIPQAAGVPAGRPAAGRYVREFIEDVKASGFVARTLAKHGLGPDDAIVAPPAALHVLVTNAAKGAIATIVPSFSSHGGRPIRVEYGQTASLVDRVVNGERPAAVILTARGVEQLVAKGLAKARMELATSTLGMAVAHDAPTPVLKTTEDLVAFLKAAPSIAIPERGASGLYLTQLIAKLGLTEVVEPKIRRLDEHTPTATLLLQREVAVAVQQVSELRMAGATNIAPLPDEIQLRSVITLATLEGADEKALGPLFDSLRSREAMDAYVRSGLLPIGPR
jgi:polar amino acid transport system substrate-binding protein